MILTKRYLIDLKIPEFDKKEFKNLLFMEKLNFGECDVEYMEDGCPSIFTDNPIEVRRKLIEFYGESDYKILVFDLDKDFS